MPQNDVTSPTYPVPVLDIERHLFEVVIPVRDELGRETGTLIFDSRWSNPWAASERADAIGGIVR